MMVFKRISDLLLSMWGYRHNHREKLSPVECGPADFEQAIIKSGYGKFNYLLLLAVLPASLANIFSSSAMSYVLPSAECDLRLTMFDKGLLNSMAFAGMISTAFFWGFMTDTFGRKEIMSYGYMFAGLTTLATSFSHTSWLLTLFKFLDGVIISGPYAALMSYLAEVHDEAHRSRTYMWLGVFFSLGNISLPCIAWLIIPRQWNIHLLNRTIEINSWRVFLAICSLPQFLACAAIFAFPESPRFLLLKGKRDEALEVFKKIYSMNTGKDPDTYPIKDLEDEYSVKTSGEGLLEILHSFWQQIKPLFLSPNLFNLTVISTIQFGATVGSSSVKLWMPQLFVMMESYKSNFARIGHADFQSSFCYMLREQHSHNMNFIANSTNKTAHHAYTCTPAELNSTVFINSIVIAVTGVVGYILAGSLITVVGKKKLMVTCFMIAAACCGSLHWADSTNSILGLSSIFVAVSSIGGATVTNVIVDSFPTCLRTMAVTVTMMIGRVGAVTGNLLFPILFNLSCVGPFIMIGFASLISAILVILVPRNSSQTKSKTVV